MSANKNENLRNAKKAKNDEFYTMLSDIENELKHYRDHFKGKIIYCNCDNPEWSNFWNYFYLNFEPLGLKKLIATFYDKENPVYKAEYDGKEVVKTPLEGNGDFRSAECIECLEEADIVVTNPPFSLFREFVGQLMEYEKKFIIIGSQNAVTYREIFPLIKNDALWLGPKFNGGNAYFRVPADAVNDYSENVYNKDTGLVKFRNCLWFTNLDIKKRHEELILYKKYNPEEYPKYDNYDAINVDKTVEIPIDYEGVMGVPISWLDLYCPEQFEIMGGFNGYTHSDENAGLICGKATQYCDKQGKVKEWTGPTINKKTKYFRILIRHKRPRKD